MPVEDVMTISGRGTVATGRVERGTAHVGDQMEIVGLKEEKLTTTITGLEMFRKSLEFAQAGDNIGALLRGIDRDQIERGQVIAVPGLRSSPHHLRRPCLCPEEGRGRPSHPRSSTTIVLSSTSAPPTLPASSPLPEGTEMLHARRQR